MTAGLRTTESLGVCEYAPLNHFRYDIHEYLRQKTIMSKLICFPPIAILGGKINCTIVSV